MMDALYARKTGSTHSLLGIDPSENTSGLWAQCGGTSRVHNLMMDALYPRTTGSIRGLSCWMRSTPAKPDPFYYTLRPTLNPWWLSWIAGALLIPLPQPVVGSWWWRRGRGWKGVVAVPLGRSFFSFGQHFLFSRQGKTSKTKCESSKIWD